MSLSSVLDESLTQTSASPTATATSIGSKKYFKQHVKTRARSTGLVFAKRTKMPAKVTVQGSALTSAKVNGEPEKIYEYPSFYTTSGDKICLANGFAGSRESTPTEWSFQGRLEKARKFKNIDELVGSTGSSTQALVIQNLENERKISRNMVANFLQANTCIKSRETVADLESIAIQDRKKSKALSASSQTSSVSSGSVQTVGKRTKKSSSTSVTGSGRVSAKPGPEVALATPSHSEGSGGLPKPTATALASAHGIWDASAHGTANGSNQVQSTHTCKVCGYKISRHSFISTSCQTNESDPDAHQIKSFKPLHCVTCSSYFHEECHYPPVDTTSASFNIDSWDCRICKNKEQAAMTRTTRSRTAKAIPGVEGVLRRHVAELEVSKCLPDYEVAKVRAAIDMALGVNSRPVSPAAPDSKLTTGISPLSCFSFLTKKLSTGGKRTRNQSTFGFGAEVCEDIIDKRRKSIGSNTFASKLHDDWDACISEHESMKKCRMQEAEQRANPSLFRCEVCAEKPMTINYLNCARSKHRELTDDMRPLGTFTPFVTCCVCYKSYHITCANPPLTAVPQNIMWHCPTHSKPSPHKSKPLDDSFFVFKEPDYPTEFPGRVDYEAEVIEYLQRRGRLQPEPPRPKLDPAEASKRAVESFSAMQDAIDLISFAQNMATRKPLWDDTETASTVSVSSGGSSCSYRKPARKRVVSENAVTAPKNVLKPVGGAKAKIRPVVLSRPNRLQLSPIPPSQPSSKHLQSYVNQPGSHEGVSKLLDILDYDSLKLIAGQYLMQQCQTGTQSSSSSVRAPVRASSGSTSPNVSSRKLLFQQSQKQMFQCSFKPIHPVPLTTGTSTHKVVSPSAGYSLRLSPKQNPQPTKLRISMRDPHNPAVKVRFDMSPGSTQLLGRIDKCTESTSQTIDVDSCYPSNSAPGRCRFIQTDHILLQCTSDARIELYAIGEFWLNGTRYFNSKSEVCGESLKAPYRRLDKLTFSLKNDPADPGRYRRQRTNVERTQTALRQYNTLASVARGCTPKFDLLCHCDELAEGWNDNSQLLDVYYEVKEVYQKWCGDSPVCWPDELCEGADEPVKTAVVESGQDSPMTDTENRPPSRLSRSQSPRDAETQRLLNESTESVLCSSFLQPQSRPGVLTDKSILRIGCHTFVTSVEYQ